MFDVASSKSLQFLQVKFCGSDMKKRNKSDKSNKYSMISCC